MTLVAPIQAALLLDQHVSHPEDAWRKLPTLSVCKRNSSVSHALLRNVVKGAA